MASTDMNMTFSLTDPFTTKPIPPKRRISRQEAERTLRMNTMNQKQRPVIQLMAVILLLSAINHPLSTLFAQGTAFTYQGWLNDGGSPANGNYDLRFAIYDLPSGGTLISGAATKPPHGAANGPFTVN